MEPIVANFKDELVAHGGVTYDVFRPSSGTVFTKHIIIGAECAVVTKATGEGVWGSTATVVGPEAVEQTIQEVNVATLALLQAGFSFFGTNPVFLGESALLALNGKNVGKTWGAG